MRRAFDEHGSFTLDVDGETVTLEPDDVEIRAEQHDDLTLAQDGPHAVALDLTLDDDLRAEGLAREIIRAVNDHRKTSGFALTDRITVALRATGAHRRRRAAPRATGSRPRCSPPTSPSPSSRRATWRRPAPPTPSIDGEPVWLALRRT